MFHSDPALPLDLCTFHLILMTCTCICIYPVLLLDLEHLPVTLLQLDILQSWCSTWPSTLWGPTFPCTSTCTLLDFWCSPLDSVLLTWILASASTC
jgi:hypothetical protein